MLKHMHICIQQSKHQLEVVGLFNGICTSCYETCTCGVSVNSLIIYTYIQEPAQAVYNSLEPPLAQVGVPTLTTNKHNNVKGGAICSVTLLG